ncbi:RcnB family protein [Xanthomonas sp. Kuri4-1]
MKKTSKFIPWLFAATAFVSVATPALAQDYGPDDRGPDRDHRDDRPRDDGPQDDRGPRGDDLRQWQRGDRYEGPRYVVDDYRRYDLPPPPDRGHRWIRDRDGNFILVAIATGVITDLLLGGGHGR